MSEELRGYGKMHLEDAIALTAEYLTVATSIGDLFDRAQKAAIAFMDMPYGIVEIADKLHELTDSDTFGHTSRENITKAITLHDFSNVDPNRAEYHTLVQAVAFKESIVRQLIRATISKEDNKLGLTDTERVFLEKGTRVQDAFDRLHLRWRDEVLHGHGFAHLRRLQQEYENQCKEDGITPDPAYAHKTYFHDVIGPHGDFLYVIPKLVDDEIVAIPYADAFKDEISGENGVAVLIDEMNQALKDLNTDDPNARGIIATNDALKELLISTTSPDDQEKLAENLDRVWVTDAPATGPNANTIRILYPMETYFDPGKKLVEFEYNLMFVDKDHNPENQLANDAKHHTLDFLSQDAKLQATAPTTLKKSIDVMRDCDATFYYILRSGTSLGFKSAASNVPNRPAVRQVATIINMDYSTFVERSEIAHGYLEKIFDDAEDDTLETYFSDTKKELEMTAIFVGLHEVGHNAFVVDDSITKLTSGIYSDLEEAKSDIFAVVGALSYLTGDDRKAYIAALFAASIRGISRWEEHEDRTHFYGDALRLQLMLDTEIVRKEGEKWIFDPSIEKIEDFWNRSREILLQFAYVYEKRDPDMARALMNDLYTESDLLKQLAQKAGIKTV